MGFFNGYNGFNGGFNDVAGAQDYNNGIVRFLRQLSPGTRVVLQYNDQKPACGIFQGFQNGTVLLSDFNGFPGLVRIAANQVNAVAPFNYGGYNG